ncbi:hypothetical protein BDV95DRAFT_589604 [Massariosphaeria phaeospora]|uniref:Uncharacterized protein n=1 Tax=Massariosphaeria phaeospora TaxID=100035 RepID=A0A7C8MFJ0_9PLEO|nr:hypothetical protein BDV95DRAFT_589604 [Massariosphaeria phaeospora]
MGLGSLIVLSLLLSTGSAQSGTASSPCPPSSVSGIPGCWGTPACTYGITNNLTQSASLNCPSGTEPGLIPTQEPSNPGPAPSNATVITGSVESDSTVTPTFVSTTYTDLSTLSIISTIVETQTEVISTVDSNTTSTTAPSLPPPPVLPDGNSTVVSSSTSGGPPPTSSSSAATSDTTDPAPPLSIDPGPTPSNTIKPIPAITSIPGLTTSDDAPLPVITSFDAAILTLASIDPSISENTAISTSDGNHPAGFYPFIRGGSSCFFCPPGVDNGGFFLWGMTKPGIYPPPVPPPVANVPWPTITIGPGNKPTPGPNPESEEPEDPQESKKSESSCTSTTASSCAVSCTKPSGQSTESCTTTKCETTSGCSVTNTASTTIKSGSCSPTDWVLQDGFEDPSVVDPGEEGPDPSYSGSVPAWVTAWPSETGVASSSTSSTDTPVESTPTPEQSPPPPEQPSPTPEQPPPAPEVSACDQCVATIEGLGTPFCPKEVKFCLADVCGRDEQCKRCDVDCIQLAEGILQIDDDDVRFARVINSARSEKISSRLSRRKVIKPTGLESPQSLHKRVDHTPSWIKYAPKGWTHYKRVQEAPMEDVGDPPMCELEDYFDTTMGKLIDSKNKMVLFEKINLTPTISYIPFFAIGPKAGKSKEGEAEQAADFQDTISAEQGVFFANANSRGGEDGQKPTPYQMSVVAWWMWKKAVMKAQAPETKEEDTDFSNFKYFFRVNINNAETSEILSEAIGLDPVPKDFTPQDKSENNAFWPLLGSPNGNTIAWFLSDHKKSLKGKGIEKITAWYDPAAKSYHFWATINPVDGSG